MLDQYHNAVFVICDSLDRVSIAKHLFCTRFKNAVVNDSMDRAIATYKAAMSDRSQSNANIPLKGLIRTHDYISEITGDHRYYIKDIESRMIKPTLGNKADVNKSSGDKFFHVVFMTEEIFSSEQFRAIKGKKIYFYDDRTTDNVKSGLAFDKMKYCSGKDDPFEPIGFSGGGTHGVEDHLRYLYRRFGFEV